MLNPYVRSQYPTAPFTSNWMNDPFNNQMTQFQGGLGDIVKPMSALMTADLVETDKDFKVHVDLPGVEDLDISVQNRSLFIKAERKITNEIDNETVHTRERQYGKVSRQLALPLNADVDKAQAVFKDGVLEVTFPKLENVPGAKKLTIN